MYTFLTLKFFSKQYYILFSYTMITEEVILFIICNMMQKYISNSAFYTLLTHEKNSLYFFSN